jgi:transcriptional regulator with XRE-family HTH domain
VTYRRAGSLLEEWLEAERLARQETARDAARACGLSPHAFARRGSCASTPRSATRRALAGYLRTTPEMVAVLARVPAEHGVKTFRSDSRTRGKRSLLGQRLRAEMLRRCQTMAEVAKEVEVSPYSLRYSVSFGARKPFRGTLSKSRAIWNRCSDGCGVACAAGGGPAASEDVGRAEAASDGAAADGERGGCDVRTVRVPAGVSRGRGARGFCLVRGRHGAGSRYGGVWTGIRA